MTDQILQCDDRQLLAILETDGGAVEHESLLDHVEICEHCQSRLQELAAGDDDWIRAGSVLSETDDDDQRTDSEFDPTSLPRFARQAEGSPDWNEEMVRQLLEPPSHPEMLGRLGRYEIERLIGSGGMGIVFKAWDTELNRPVAIKILAPGLAASNSARMRFSREARSAAGVVDDHVIPIHNVESENNPPFLVMQYMAGGSLQETIDRDGPLEVSEIVRIGLQTAKGLAAAHAQGVIHRDVKPSNILLDEGVERALLSDFGLAHTENDAGLTHSGFHPGTPHYMSPEQVRGEAIDARSDLFSLGCVLYCLCTGRPPFQAESGYAVLRAITDETPLSIRELNSNVPEWLERIVVKLLSKSRDDRFSSALEVAELLAGCLSHLHDPVTTPLPDAAKKFPRIQTRINSIHRWLAGSFAAAAVLLAGIVIFLESNKGTLRIESDLDDIPIRVMQGDELVRKLIVSRDGSEIRIAAGEYIVVVDALVGAIRVDGENVSLERGEGSLVRLTYVSNDVDTASRASDFDRWKQEPPKLSPFTDIRFENDGVIVTYDSEEYSWLAIDGIEVEDVINAAKRQFDDRWQKRIAEDLVEVLWGMEHRPGKVVRLRLADLHSGRIRNVARASMTEENRLEIYGKRRAAEEVDAGTAESTGPMQPISDLPSDTQVHVVGCYGASDDQPVDVRVKSTDAPMVVVLSAYNATSWNVRIDEDANVRGVILSGYFDQRFSHIAPGKSIPTRIHSYFPVWRGITQEEKDERFEQCFFV